ncbi:MAG: VWA domain-containing protein [Myxococcales bacterium]|nr:VWA domain-containing protein [Myxococcales bacterium]
MRNSAHYGLRSFGWTLLIFLLSVLVALVFINQLYDVPWRAGSVRFRRPAFAFLLVGPMLVWFTRGLFQHRLSPRLRFSHAALSARLGTSMRTWLRPVLLGMRLSALALVVIALMGPQSIHAKGTTQVQGIDLILTLDLSLSMQAEDIRPNRFIASKQVVAEFINRRPQDRIGAVVFGRDAYTLMPLTTDHSALSTAIIELELGIIDGKGTAIGNAVGVALNRLRNPKTKSKAIILLTDGNSNSGNISPKQAAGYARAMNVKLYTILMGSTDETSLSRGKSLFGMTMMDRGNFPINPELLKEMAQQTDGRYFQVTDRRGLERSFHSILDALEKTDIKDSGVVYGELFMPFLGLGIALLFLEALGASLLFRRWP